jgi:glutamine amidotransferase-like uncharacterized protein
MKPTIAIFIHDPQCETECALGMIDGLVRDFDIRTFGIADLNTQFLAEFDAVCFPGGMGDADDFDKIFTEDHISAVQEYVICGGKYFGICMGAYWAGKHYFDITTDLTIGQYIERPTADIDYDGPTVAEIAWGNYNTMMYFYDGCAILGDNMEVVATYLNGDPMAVMQGNVGMIGCHPEALSWWYTEGEMNDLYDPKHAQLMSNFLQDLINE